MIGHGPMLFHKIKNLSQITYYNYDKKNHYTSSCLKTDISLEIFLLMTGITIKVNKANIKSNSKPEEIKLQKISYI